MLSLAPQGVSSSGSAESSLPISIRPHVFDIRIYPLYELAAASRCRGNVFDCSSPARERCCSRILLGEMLSVTILVVRNEGASLHGIETSLWAWGRSQTCQCPPRRAHTSEKLPSSHQLIEMVPFAERAGALSRLPSY